MVAVKASLGTGDPLTDAIFQGGLSIQGRGDFAPKPGALMVHALKKPNVQVRDFLGQEAEMDRDTLGLKSGHALTGHQGVGVEHAHVNLGNSGLEQGVTAWGCASGVRARLQRHVHRGALSTQALGPHVVQGHDLGVRKPHRLCVSLTQNLALWAHDHAAHSGVGGGEEEGFFSLGQGPLHPRQGVIAVGSSQGLVVNRGGHLEVIMGRSWAGHRGEVMGEMIRAR